MPFCTECGGEISPDKKFCESCGAPLDAQQLVPASDTPVPIAQQPLEPAPGTPVQRPPTYIVPSPAPKKFLTVPLIIGCILLLGIIIAGALFIGVPNLQKNPAAAGTTTVSATPAVTFTPPGTLPPVTPNPVATATTSSRKLEGRYEEYYDEIYTKNQFFAFGQKETFAYDLTTPPLYIKYNLTPKLITRAKVVDIGLSSEKTISVTYPNPNAWFEVTVLNAANGAVVDKQGYGKDYPDVTRSEFMVRNQGNYQIVFSGNDVTADITVLKGTS